MNNGPAEASLHLSLARARIADGALLEDALAKAPAVNVQAGFADVWPLLHPGNAGLTCCFGEDLTVPGGTFDQRIDYVLTRGLFDPRAATVTGTNPAVRVKGLWPSDHGGIFAEVRIGDSRFDDDR